jgi:hypothetical protein
MGKKLETIRKALNHHGIPLTEGIPEHIIDELHKNGYVIRKSKAWKQQQKKELTQLSTEPSMQARKTDADAVRAKKR